MRLCKTMLLISVLLLSMVVSGCDDEKKPEPEPQKKAEEVKETKPPVQKKPEVKKEEAKEISLKVYFPNEEGTKLIPVTKKVKVLQKDKYKAAIEELLKGADKKGMISVIPKKTKLRGLSLQNGVATCDFSGDIVKYFVGGSTGEELMIASIVNTLTDFSEIKSVKILVDGKEVETIAGHMDLTAPISRMDY